MDINTQKRYAEAMKIFIDSVQNSIEDKIDDWKNENPYWEIDGDDGLPEHCPATNNNDARVALSDDFVSSGENVENVDCVDFFEFVINEIYGFGIKSKSPYRTNLENKVLTPEEKAIAAINLGTANFINELCGSLSK